MPKALWIAAYRSVSDPQALAEYARLSAPALIASGARPLARGLPAKVLEQGISQRTVVLEFDSIEHALAAYACEPYQAARAILGNTAERDIRLIEMLE